MTSPIRPFIWRLLVVYGVIICCARGEGAWAGRPPSTRSCARVFTPLPEILARMEKALNPSVFPYMYSVPDLLLWKRYQEEQTRAFIHLRTGQTADLSRPFAAFFSESRRAGFYSLLRRGDLFEEASRATPGTLSPGTRSAQLGFLAVRSDIEGNLLSRTEMVVQQPVPEGRDHHVLYAFDAPQTGSLSVQQSYDVLYREYARQGKGRSDHLRIFRDEDRQTALRTTHFVIHLNGEIVAHIQAQHSTHPTDLLNLEAHFGRLERQPGELIFELGRLRVVDESQLRPETVQALHDVGGRDYVRTLLFQKAFTWLAADAKAPRVVMQVNSRGRDHLMRSSQRGFGQWQFDGPGRKVVDDPDRQEWVLSISGENLRKTEEEEMLSLIEQEKKRARRAGIPTPAGPRPANTLSLFIRESERPVIDRLMQSGRLTGLIGRKDFPDPGEVHFYDHGTLRFDPQVAYLYFAVEP